MGLFDKLKGLAGDKDAKKKLQGIAAKADDQAEKLSKKDGVVGDAAGKAHNVLDKIDGD